MPQCGFFVSFNGKNLDVIIKTPIFWVIFYQNRQIWPPGVLIYRDISCCLVTYFKETVSCFISKVLMWLFCPNKWFKMRSKKQNAKVLGIFGSKYGYFTPCGDRTGRYSLLFRDSFWRNDIIICFKCHNVAALHHLMVKTWRLLAKHQYFGSFWSKNRQIKPSGAGC